MTRLEALWRDVPLTTGSGHTGTAIIGVTWTTTDPFVVRALISTRTQTRIDWALSRDALYAGLTGPVGAAGSDWMVFPDLARPDGEGIELVLAVHGRGVGCQASLLLDTAVVRDFVEATFEVVPAGTEVDRYLDELAGGAA